MPGFRIHLREQHGITGGWRSQVIVVGWAVSGLYLVGAVVYLSFSSLAAVAAVSD